MQEEKRKQKENEASGWWEKLDPRWDHFWGRIPKLIKFSAYFSLYITAVSILIFRYNPDTESAEFIGYLFGSAFLFLQIWHSSRRATAAEETIALTEKGNIHERFKNAIEHLGSDSASIRLGGIYALHNLARDVENYREQVFDILCAHIRDTTTRLNYKIRLGSSDSNKPTIEIQSILNLLFGKGSDREVYKGCFANLEGANLQNVNLKSAWLERANLSSANLEKATLMGARLYCASMHGANLQHSNLSDADALRSYINNANMQHANLAYANFSRASINDSDLRDTVLIGTSFFAAFLWTVDLRNSIFDDANLDSADLSSSNLESAYLNKAKNLEVEQLLETGSLYNAKLPNGMAEKVMEEKPELFKDFSDTEDP